MFRDTLRNRQKEGVNIEAVLHEWTKRKNIVIIEKDLLRAAFNKEAGKGFHAKGVSRECRKGMAKCSGNRKLFSWMARLLR